MWDFDYHLYEFADLRKVAIPTRMGIPTTFKLKCLTSQNKEL